MDGKARQAPVGRGRGRRTKSSLDDVAQDTHKNEEENIKKIVKQLQPSSINHIIELLSRPNVPNERCQELLNETIEEVCSNVLENVEFVEVAAKLLKCLWDTDLPSSASVRKPLLSRIQTIYRTRDKLTNTEFEGYATLFCELFSCLTINDDPLAALSKPVFVILQELLCERGNSESNILTFHMLVCKHGSFLEKQEKIKMSELMGKVRDMAISDENSKVKKCILLEIIEQHASSWNLPESVEGYYSNTLAELMTSI